ncbi:MAG: VWA domain-containing protein [Acidobacteria bacterium]|nr:VWA domain-containing protein [Acidobacteriota bacterium]
MAVKGGVKGGKGGDRTGSPVYDSLQPVFRRVRPFDMYGRLLAALLTLQNVQNPPSPNIRTTVPLVLVPTTVTDREGKAIHGLTEEDFLLYDGGKVWPHQVEFTAQPVSVVLCIQNNTAAGPALAKILKVGSMVLPHLAGERGAAAIITYGDQVRLRTDFTADASQLGTSFRTLRPQGANARLLDAIQLALHLLAARSGRRVILVVGESRDRGSESKLDAVLEDVTRSNVTIYPVTYSVYLTSFTTKGAERFGQDECGDESRKPPVYQSGAGLSLISAFSELSRLGKTNTAEALARSTGGERLSFTRLKALEQVLEKISEDLHAQYLLSF